MVGVGKSNSNIRSSSEGRDEAKVKKSSAIGGSVEILLVATQNEGRDESANSTSTVRDEKKGVGVAARLEYI